MRNPQNSLVGALHTFFLQNKRCITSVFIFSVILVLLCFPYLNWGCIADDFGIIFNSKINSIKDIKNFFGSQSIATVLNSSNHVQKATSFFDSLYRPLLCVFFGVQEYFFGSTALYYFWVLIFLHATNAVILFNMFYGFFAYGLALWGALFFAFHSSYMTWLGWIVCQMYHLNLLLFLLVLLLFRKYLQSHKYHYYIFSCFFYMLSLFLHESMIVFPLWLPFAVYFYESWEVFDRLSLRGVFRYVSMSFGFWMMTAFYLFVRISNFPLKWGESDTYMTSNISTFFYKLSGRFMQLVSFASDILGFAWMPGGHRAIKGTLIILFSTILLWLFIKNNRKRYLLFFVLSFLLFMWPAILVYYHPRYFYLSLPFFILAILFCVRFYNVSTRLQRKRFQRGVYTFLYALLVWNSSFLIAHMKYKENFLNVVNRAFKEISMDKQVKNRPLCFIGVPSSRFPQSVAPAMWMYLGDSSNPVYHALEWSLDMEGVVKGDPLEILSVRNGFRLISKNPEQLYFYGSWDDKSSGGTFSMGKSIVNRRIPGKIYDKSFVFDEKWLSEDILFISWNFGREKFVILDKKPIK